MYRMMYRVDAPTVYRAQRSFSVRCSSPFKALISKFPNSLDFPSPGVEFGLQVAWQLFEPKIVL
ncbi:hypothetical protein AKJ16_DCAP12476 [Drosera capensis]